MKIIMTAIALIFYAGASQALVSDSFSCTLKITDLESQTSTQQQQNFFVARLPLSFSPSPDVRITTGETQSRLRLETKKADLIANVNFYYKHAVKNDASGSPVEARQFSCIGIGGGYCPKRASGNGPIPCYDSEVACMEFPDPFDPAQGWTPTSLISGVPAFDDRVLSATRASITDDTGRTVGTINFDCKYRGSFH